MALHVIEKGNVIVKGLGVLRLDRSVAYGDVNPNSFTLSFDISKPDHECWNVQWTKCNVFLHM